MSSTEAPRRPRTPARWALAFRLARREVRRHPWRHALVVLMVTVPVLAAMAAFSAISTFDRIDADKRSYNSYGADLAVSPLNDPLPSDWFGFDEAGLETVRGLLPEGSRVASAWRSVDWLSTHEERPDGGGPVLVGTSTTSAPTPETFGERFRVDRGRGPQDEAEVFLTQELAARGRWDVGDVIESGRDDRSFTVSGIGVARDDVDLMLAVLGPVPQSYWTSRPAGYDSVIIDHPRSQADRTWQEVRELRAQRDTFVWLPPGTNAGLASQSLFDPDQMYARAVEYSTVDHLLGPGMAIVFAALAAIVAIVASAAFAIASRRQLRSVGLLATAGADPSVIRSALVLQGALPGLAAAALALGLGLVCAWVLGPGGVLESRTRVAGATTVISIGGVLLAVVLGVLAGTMAAWWPARSASRIPVLSALAGRRPIGPVPTNVPLTGLVSVAIGGVGLAVLVRRVDTNSGSAEDVVAFTPLLMLVTVLAMLFGLVAMAPTLVATVGRLSAKATGTTRIALRGLARHRTQSSAAVAAVAICMAIPVGVLTTKASLDDEADREARWLQQQRPPGAGAEVGTTVPERRNTSVLGGSHLPIVLKGDLNSPQRDRLEADIVEITGPLVEVPLIAFGDGRGAWQVVAAMQPADARSMLAPWAADAIESGRAVALSGPAGSVLLDDDVNQIELDAVADPAGSEAHLSQWAEADYLVPATILTQVGVGRPPVNLVMLTREQLGSDEAEALERLMYQPAQPERFEHPTLAELRSALAAGKATDATALESPGPYDPVIDTSPTVWFDLDRSSMEGEANYVEAPLMDRPDSGEVVFRRWLRTVALAAGLLSLLVLTITLSLRAVDSVDDHRAAVAAGAAPARIRRQRSLEGVVLASLGALLALPLGWLPVTAVRFGQVRKRYADDGTLDAISSRLHVPGWEVVPILAIPVVVVGVLWLVGPWIRGALRRQPVDQVLPRY